MTARVLNEIFFKNFVYVCSLSRPGDKTRPRFTTFDALLTVLSIATFFSDIATDVIVVTQYARSELWVYAGMTLFFVVMPSIVVNLFSLRWHIHDKRGSRVAWVVNVLQLGVLHRYLLSLKTGLRAERTQDPDDFQDLYQQHSDLCMLRLFDSFLESAPQLVLQLYIMVTYEDWNLWTGISALLSLLSLGWGIAAYGKAMRLYRAEKKQLSWTGLILQTVWRFGTMTSRVTAMVLLASVCGPWTLLILGCHWLLMTVWVTLHNTDFCPSRWEERVYNAVVGVIYTFCFFNIEEGHSRRRVVLFYAFTATQNMAFLLVYCLAQEHDPTHVAAASAVVLTSFATGMCCMALYYRFFHPSGPIPICRRDSDTSQNGKVVAEADDADAPAYHSTPKEKTKQPSAAVNASHSFRTLKYVDYRHQSSSTPRHWSVDRPPRNGTFSPVRDDTPSDELRRSNDTPDDSQLSANASPSTRHLSELRTSFVDDIVAKFLNCSLEERHRSHSHNCTLAEHDAEDASGGGGDDFNAMRERTSSRHRVVNFNFRPAAANNATPAFRRHCSCLVLFTLEDGLDASRDGARSVRRGLQGVMSAPNVRLQRVPSGGGSELGSWSMCNYLPADGASLVVPESSLSDGAHVDNEVDTSVPLFDG
ncbi:XK-related protein 6 [Ixodes scapularis]|uniref:XK-related protein 6 n=1 Tax=Ixodes scapularis TaxID=6945 RepID=UPI001C38C316|nr:XK-related protein 6 [Ixodes scapularis]